MTTLLLLIGMMSVMLFIAYYLDKQLNYESPKPEIVKPEKDYMDDYREIRKITAETKQIWEDSKTRTAWRE